jgi:hypothetical protein
MPYVLEDDDYQATLDELERLTDVVEALEEALKDAGVKPWVIERIKENAYNGR